MISKLRFSLILGAMIAAMAPFASSKFEEQVARVSAVGVAVYIPVESTAIQDKLDVFEGLFDGPQLYIPEGKIYPGQPYRTHLVNVDVSHVTFQDFVESGKYDLDGHSIAESIEVTLSIPYLSASPGGPTEYDLGMVVITDRGDRPRPEFILPYIQADEIEMQDNQLYVRVGQDEIRIEFDSFGECDGSSGGSEDDERVLQLSLSGASSLGGYCRDYPYREVNTFCSVMEDIAWELHDNSPNVCTTWKSIKENSCKTEAKIINISGNFATLLSYKKGTQPVAVEQFDGTYNIGAQFPCV